MMTFQYIFIILNYYSCFFQADWQNLVETLEYNVIDMMKFIKRIKALWILYQRELAETRKTTITNVEKIKQACNKEEEASLIF